MRYWKIWAADIEFEATKGQFKGKVKPSWTTFMPFGVTKVALGFVMTFGNPVGIPVGAELES